MANRGRKSAAEAQVERVTWFLMVLVFAILSIIPEETYADIPNGVIPLAGAIIVLGSGIYQYGQHWRVSPVTWIAGAFMLLLATINFTVSPDQDFYGLTLLTFAAVIGMGVLTGET